jgi:hypothetical protein
MVGMVIGPDRPNEIRITGFFPRRPKRGRTVGAECFETATNL